MKKRPWWHEFFSMFDFVGELKRLEAETAYWKQRKEDEIAFRRAIAQQYIDEANYTRSLEAE